MKKLKILLFITLFGLFSFYGLQSCTEKKQCHANSSSHQASEKCGEGCMKKCCEKKCEKETCNEECKHEKEESDSIE